MVLALRRSTVPTPATGSIDVSGEFVEESRLAQLATSSIRLVAASARSLKACPFLLFNRGTHLREEPLLFRLYGFDLLKRKWGDSGLSLNQHLDSRMGALGSALVELAARGSIHDPSNLLYLMNRADEETGNVCRFAREAGR